MSLYKGIVKFGVPGGDYAELEASITTLCTST
jgi:hypothetical protein